MLKFSLGQCSWSSSWLAILHGCPGLAANKIFPSLIMSVKVTLKNSRKKLSFLHSIDQVNTLPRVSLKRPLWALWCGKNPSCMLRDVLLFLKQKPEYFRLRKLHSKYSVATHRITGVFPWSFNKHEDRTASSLFSQVTFLSGCCFGINLAAVQYPL